MGNFTVSSTTYRVVIYDRIHKMGHGLKWKKTGRGPSSYKSASEF